MNSAENQPCPYCKKGKKPGVLHIFNHNNFNKNLDLEERTGTDFDVKELKETFNKYHVKTYRHDDFPLKEIRRKIEQISKTDFSENSCIVVVFLSHGLQNNVIAAKDEFYYFDEMILKIQSNKTLILKPKIFIIESCRGAKSNKIVKEYVKINSNITPDYFKETYVFNSCSELLESYRSEAEGTPFIQYFCKFFNEFGSKKPIGDIFDLVNISLQKEFNQITEIKRNTGAPYTFGDYCKFLDETEENLSTHNSDNVEQCNNKIEDLSALELSDNDDGAVVTPTLEYAKETDQLTINEKAEKFIKNIENENVEKWIKNCPCGHIPENPVRGGTDLGGEPIYIGRGTYSHELMPAKVFLDKNHAFVSWAGKEHKLTDFEILTGTGFSWIPAAHGYVPPNAVKGGIALDKETLYIGRTTHDTTVTPGKIHPSHGFLYISFDGKEVRFFHYEVLVKKKTKK